MGHFVDDEIFNDPGRRSLFAPPILTTVLREKCPSFAGKRSLVDGVATSGAGSALKIRSGLTSPNRSSLPRPKFESRTLSSTSFNRLPCSSRSSKGIVLFSFCFSLDSSADLGLWDCARISSAIVRAELACSRKASSVWEPRERSVSDFVMAARDFGAVAPRPSVLFFEIPADLDGRLESSRFEIPRPED